MYNVKDIELRKNIFKELWLYTIWDFYDWYALAKKCWQWEVFLDYFYVHKNKEILSIEWLKFSEHFSEWYALVEDENKKFWYIDTSWNIVIKPQFEDAYIFQNWYARIKENDKYGTINKKWEIIIKPKYDYPIYFQNWYALVVLWEKHLFVNEKWDEFERSFYEGNSYIYFWENEKIWIKNSNWEIILEPNYNWLWEISDWYIWAYINQKDWDVTNEKYWLIDLKWNIIIPMIYDSIWDYWEWLIWASKWKKSYYIDLNNEIKIDLWISDYCWKFKNWYALISNEYKYWIIDKYWNIIIKPIYGKIEFLDENFIICTLHKENKIKNFFQKKFKGYQSYWQETWVINIKWETIIPFLYDYSFLRDWYITFDRMNWNIREFYNYFYDWTLMSEDIYFRDFKKALFIIYKNEMFLYWLKEFKNKILKLYYKILKKK